MSSSRLRQQSPHTVSSSGTKLQHPLAWQTMQPMSPLQDASAVQPWSQLHCPAQQWGAMLPDTLSGPTAAQAMQLA